MKKELVKALSLGLTAATIAGSMDMTVMAAEGDPAEGEPSTTNTSGEESSTETPTPEESVVQDVTDFKNDFNGEDGVVEAAENLDQCSSEDPAVQESFDKLINGDVEDDPIMNDELKMHVVYDEDNKYARDENGDIITREEGDPTLTSWVGLKDDRVNEYVGAANDDITQLQQDVNTVKDAADDIDNYTNQIEGYNDAQGEYQPGILDKAEDAAGKAESAANTASQVVAEVVDAVDNDAADVNVKIQNADTVVQNAEKTIADQRKEIEALKEQLEQAIDDRDKAIGIYDGTISAILSSEVIDPDTDQVILPDGSIVSAEKNLEMAEEHLAELKAMLKEKLKAYEATAGYQLFEAEENYAKDGDVQTYLEAVLANHVFEDESFTIENFDSAAKTFVVVNGNSKVKYEYSVDNGVVTVNEVDKRYEWTVTDPQTNETVTINKTETELNEMLAAKKAVKRYTVEKDGKTSYALETELTDEEKASLPFTYIILVTDFELDESQSDALDTEHDETVTNYGIAVRFFDIDGNYVEMITNDTTKTITKIVNGQVVEITSTASNAKTDAAATAGLSTELNNTISYLEREYKTKGFTYKDADGNTITVAASDVVSVGNASLIENTLNVKWKVDGFYVPVYTGDGRNHEVKISEDSELALYLTRLLAGTVKQKEEQLTREFQADNPDYYALYSKLNDGVDLTGTTYYLKTYDINITTEFNSRKDAIDAVETLAIAEQKNRNSHDEFVWDWYDSHWETVYDDAVTGIVREGDYASKITTDATAKQNASYDVTINEHHIGIQKLIFTDVQAAAADVGKRTLFTNAGTNTDYNDKVSKAAADGQAIALLISNTETARQKVLEAKENLEDIEDKISELYKIDDTEDLVLVNEWDFRLEAAIKRLEDAENNFDKTKKDLQDAIEKQNGKSSVNEDQSTGGTGGIGGTGGTGGISTPITYQLYDPAIIIPPTEVVNIDSSVHVTDDDTRSNRTVTESAPVTGNVITAAHVSAMIESALAANPTETVLDIDLGNDPSLTADTLIALCEKNNVAKRCHFTHNGMKFVLFIPVVDPTSATYQQCKALLDVEPGKQAGPIRLSLLFAPVGFSLSGE